MSGFQKLPNTPETPSHISGCTAQEQRGNRDQQPVAPTISTGPLEEESFSWERLRLDQLGKLLTIIGSGSHVATLEGVEMNTPVFQLSDFPKPEGLLTRELAEHTRHALAAAVACDWMRYELKDVVPMLRAKLGSPEVVEPVQPTWSREDVAFLRSAFGNRRFVVMFHSEGESRPISCLTPSDGRNLFDSGYWTTKEQATLVATSFAMDSRLTRIEDARHVRRSQPCVVDVLKVLEAAVERSSASHLRRDGFEVAKPVSDYIDGKVSFLSWALLGNLDGFLA